MNISNNLKVIYKFLNDYKYNLFCNSMYCTESCYICHQDKKDMCKENYNIEDEILLKKIACDFLEDNFCRKESYENDRECEEECIDLINLLMKIMIAIEKSCNYDRNYGFLLQIDKLECILINFKSLLCQLRCLNVKCCDLISEALCYLYLIIEILVDVVSKINNIECLFDSNLCCKCEITTCMICDLENEVNYLENVISDLSCTVFEIASKNIINCTTCSTAEYSKYKKRDYYNKY